MEDKLIYEYAIIRLIPRVDREEFINIGVIVFCKVSNYIGVKINLNEERAKSLFKDLDISAVIENLTSFQMIVEGNKEGGPIAEYDVASRFRWLTAKRSTVIQTSVIHSGLTNNEEATLQCLFDEMVDIKGL
jgi:hypothetical protein